MSTEKTRRPSADTQRRRKPKREKCVSLFARGHYLKVALPVQPPAKGGGGVRGVVSAFSAQSRKRMLDTLAQIDENRAGFMAFVTLTYPDRDGPPSFEQTSRDKATFLKRIRRRFPEASAIWRREWEPRISGEFEGVLYPHFHLLFFNLPFLHYEEVNDTWKEVIAYDDYTRTEIKAVESWRKAFYYVSKYMAKGEGLGCSDVSETSGPEALPAGAGSQPLAIRRSRQLAADGAGGEGVPLSSLVNPEQTASSGAAVFTSRADIAGRQTQDGARDSTADGDAGPEALPGGGEAAARCDAPPARHPPDSLRSRPPRLLRSGSLVYVTYLTGDDEKEDGDEAPAAPANSEKADKADNATSQTGRYWGVFNRNLLPFADCKTARVPVGAWIAPFREKAGEIWAPAGEANGNGFTLFAEDAPDWIDLAKRLERGEPA